MLVKKEIQKVLSQLAEGHPSHIAVDGTDITIRFLDLDSKLSLTTPVYLGGNYIPPSVRKSLSQQPVSHSSIRTFVTIDEPHFQINLNYLGHANSLSQHEVGELIEEFGFIAERWRFYLDENDKNDLIYSRK